MTKPTYVAAGVAAVGAALAVLVILPAETGYDPTGVGEALGLTEIAEPVNEELVRGQERMASQDVLLLSDTAPELEEGVSDLWEYELAPFESIEFKYTIPEGARVAFIWEGSDVLSYDMHAHPFAGGEEVTESYGVDAAQKIQGVYIAPFTGIHGWFWENRTLDNVTIRLETSGGFTHSTIFGQTGPVERPIAGVEANIEGSAAGHEMQNSE